MSDANIKFDSDARSRLIVGAEKLAKAVSVTLGPMGRTVAICVPGQPPRITKDGVTVSNAITLQDTYENIGASLVKEAAQRSAEVAGDGTTTSTVLANAIIQQGQKLLGAGYKIDEVIAGFRDASNAVKKELEKSRVHVVGDEVLENVATISANGEHELGKLITQAIRTVGPDGAVSVQEAKGYETKLVIVDGTYIDRGYESPYFVTNSANQTCELEDTYVLVINDTVATLGTILPALERTARSGGSLLIICNEIGGEAMQALVLNRVKGGLKVCAIKAPEFAGARTTAMQDLASLCGCRVLTNAEEKLDASQLDGVLGRVKKVVTSKTSTVLYGTKPDDTHEERIQAAKSAMADPALSDSEKAIAERRLRRLSNGIAVLQVGGATEGEMRERKDRADDALHAVKAAIREGVQPGGGVALARAKERAMKLFPAKNDRTAGARAFLSALDAPLRQIAANCGQSPDIVVQKALKMPESFGYNGKDNRFGNMFELGIVDPHLVVMSAVEHSTSVGCNLLSIGCIIIQEEPSSDGIQNFGSL
jgi:chaperonin GroEL